MKEADPIEYAQKAFERNIEAIRKSKKKAEFSETWRKVLAYILKAIAIFGAIAVAAGVGEKHSQIIGIAIAVAVGIDQLMSNSKNLVSFARAAATYDALENRAVRKHELSLIPVIGKVREGDQSAREDLQRLLEELISLIHTQSKKIEDALAQRRIESLVVLELENKSNDNISE
ncbi:MAG: hypothetical protein AAF530_00690 [Pseudomonadota bacterium]